MRRGEKEHERALDETHEDVLAINDYDMAFYGPCAHFNDSDGKHIVRAGTWHGLLMKGLWVSEW